METLSNKEQTRRKNPLIIPVVILIAGLALLAWLYMSTRSRLETMIDEKENQRVELKFELDSLIAEHNEMKEEYGALSDSLTSQDSLIQANALEIRKLLDTKYEFYLVKKKLDRLRVISQGYLKQMDSLYNVNRELKQENEEIRSSYRQEQEKSSTLLKDKEELTDRVTKAAVLRAYRVTATGVRGSGTKEDVNDKARRVEKIKVCFTLGENPLLSTGQKNIYVRIAGPDQLILSRGIGDEYSFSMNGEVLQYSIKEIVNYQGKAVDLCLYWLKRSTKDDMKEGTYVVSVYTEEGEIGQTTFELR